MARQAVKRTVTKTKEKRKPLNRLAVKSIDHRFIGDEPVDLTDKDYGKALAWYSYSCDEDQARTWLLEYAKRELTKDTFKAIQSASKWKIPNTIGWQARMMLNGNKLSESSMNFFHNHINTIVNSKPEFEETETDVVKEKPSVRDRTMKKSIDLLAEAEDVVVDQRGSMYEFLVGKEASAIAANHLKTFYVKVYDELMSDDNDIKEAYGKKLRIERKFWQTLIDDLDRYLGNKKVTKERKPRAKKAKPLSDQVKNLQYQKDFPQLKIVSVNPVELIGAQQVWTFNTKYNKLTKLQAQGPVGLQVKGTTIIGVDEENSCTKRIRKPEVSISQLLGAGKITLRKFMDEIKSLALEPATRINNTTVILRVIK